ncbi:MAG: endonuclease III [Gemmatimonadaceae bacterium]
MKGRDAPVGPTADRPLRVRTETRSSKQTRALEVFRRLELEYPDVRCELDYSSPFQLLAATILSAQCTDKRVNMVTPALFARYPDPELLAAADPAELEALIKPTGFFRNKTKSLIGMAAALVDRFGGQVPRSMEELVTVPGAGRKTANVVLGTAFNQPEGVVVDTHVGRVSRRLGLVRADDPVRAEQELIRLFPREDWTALSHLLIFHGRRVCVARRPRCAECVLNDLCPSSEV